MVKRKTRPRKKIPFRAGLKKSTGINRARRTGKTSEPCLAEEGFFSRSRFRTNKKRIPVAASEIAGCTIRFTRYSGPQEFTRVTANPVKMARGIRANLMVPP